MKRKILVATTNPGKIAELKAMLDIDVELAGLDDFADIIGGKYTVTQKDELYYEPKGKRIASLGINVQRCGATNIVFSIMPGQKFKDQKFDKILVDAPCTGTGAIRKSLKTLKILWIL